MCRPPTRETQHRRSQGHGSSSEKWLIINSAGKGCPPPPRLCGEASLDPAESWKVLHPWLLWLPPSLSVCLPLQTGSSPRAGNLLSSCISNTTNCNDRVLWLILSPEASARKDSGVSGASLSTRGGGDPGPPACFRASPVPFRCPPSPRLVWTQVLLQAATSVFFFPPEAPSPSLHPDTLHRGSQEELEEGAGWGWAWPVQALLLTSTHSGQHFLHLIPHCPGRSAQASSPSSTNTPSRWWFVEDTGWLPPALVPPSLNGPRTGEAGLPHAGPWVSILLVLPWTPPLHSDSTWGCQGNLFQGLRATRLLDEFEDRTVSCQRASTALFGLDPPG